MRRFSKKCCIYKHPTTNPYVAKGSSVFQDTVTYHSSTSSIGITTRCGLWPLEQHPSIFFYQSPTFCIFLFPALEELFPSFPGQYVISS